MTEIREALRAWLEGAGLRTAAERAGVDRKTARRYVEAAVSAGLARDGGEAPLTDELLGVVAGVVRPVRPGGHGSAWDTLEACHGQVRAWVDDGLSVVKIGVLLERQGVRVPYRTLHRFCAQRCGFGRNAPTVRVADGEPGAECQLDFGYMGLLHDPVTGKRRKVHALIFTAAAGAGIDDMDPSAAFSRCAHRGVTASYVASANAESLGERLRQAKEAIRAVRRRDPARLSTKAERAWRLPAHEAISLKES